MQIVKYDGHLLWMSLCFSRLITLLNPASFHCVQVLLVPEVSLVQWEPQATPADQEQLALPEGQDLVVFDIIRIVAWFSLANLLLTSCLMTGNSTLYRAYMQNLAKYNWTPKM